MARRASEQCEMDMTPMIDVVFQLIIFFVVTLKMTADFNKDIILEDGKHGITLTHENQLRTLPKRQRISSAPRTSATATRRCWRRRCSPARCA